MSATEMTPAQQFVAAFRNSIQGTLVPKIEKALTEQRQMEASMLQRWKGHRMAGVSWPSSSYSVYCQGNEFHFNMPARLADEESIALVNKAMSAAEEVSGLKFDGRRVSGGSNYVVHGRLEPKPEQATDVKP